MADGSSIQWTDATWSPVTGCTRVSAACEHCYIERTPPFRMAGRRFDRPGIGGTTGVMVHPERLGQPAKWRKARRVFVCSLADLFHDEVPDAFIADVFAAMASAPQHTFQVLTKRPARLRSLLGGDDGSGHRLLAAATSEATAWALHHEWPLPNVWIGVSVEDQATADLRIPLLLRTPAAVRFLSREPLLAPVDLGRWLNGGFGEVFPGAGDLHWVITGGESGPRSRPTDVQWLRDIRDQCAEAGVAQFFKQAGTVLARQWGCTDRTGHTPAEWPEPFPRQYPDTKVSTAA